MAVLNTVNLTSAAGWILVSAARCSVRARDGYWEATGYRWPVPPARAFTVGCVVISRGPLPDSTWRHEVVHMRQYAALGPLFWPAYAAAAGYSLLRTGDWWSRNYFERRAGLAEGGYPEERRPAARAARRDCR